MKIRSCFLFFMLPVLFCNFTNSQPLTGNKTIDNTGGGDYSNFADAVSALNTSGVGSGGVTFNIIDGQTFTSDPLVITATGTPTSPVIFRKSGSGTRPVINFTGSSLSEQAGFKFISSDYITVDGLEIIDAGKAMEYGFNFSGTADDGCRYNTVKNCIVDLDKGSSNHYGVYIQSSATSDVGKNIANKFIDNIIKDCYVGYYFLTNSPLYQDEDNEINSVVSGSSIIENIASEGIIINNQSNLIISNTSIQNISSYSPYGISCKTGTNNSVIISGNTISGLAGSGPVYGIDINTAADIRISDNTIHNLSSTGGDVYPIRISNSANNNIFNNNILDIEYSGTSNRTATGINVSSGGTTSIYNNMIAGIKAPASTHTKAGTSGIFLSGGQNVRLFYNSVLLNYISTGESNISAALYVEANSPVNVLYSNNIFVNNVDATIGIRAAAFAKGSSGGNSYISNLSSDSDNNLYYAGIPGNKNFIFYDGVQTCQTLEEYQSFVGSKGIDMKAVTEDVPFVSSSPPYDLHINSSVATLLESAGKPVTTPIVITTDFDDNVRNATTPDIGADEGNFLSNDIVAPVISFNPLENTENTVNRVVNNISITDYSGINVVPGTKPRLYFKRLKDLNVYNDNTSSTPGWKWAEADNDASPFSFTINYSSLVSGNVSSGDIIQCFIVAQDNNSTPNIGISSGIFNSPPVSVALTSEAFPVTGDLNNFSISFSGSYSVGSGHKYTSLTSAGGLFEAISSGSFSGNVEIKITSDLSEDGTVALTQWQESGSGGYTLTISPLSSEMNVISGASASGLIKISGCSRVSFDGRYSGEGIYLTFRNTDLTGPVFVLSGDSKNNTLQYLKVESSSNDINNAAIKFGSGSNNDNTVNSCEITDLNEATASPRYGIYLSGAGNINTRIINNTIYNYGNAGIILHGGCSGTLIEKNNIYSTKPSTLGSIYGIHLRNCNLTTILSNRIHDLQGSEGVGGIYFEGSSSVISAQIINNMITLSPQGRTTSGILYSGHSTNSIKIFHNSVYIGGTLNSGPYDSYAFGKSSDVNVLNLKNNIFVNGRTNNGGTGEHFAVMFNTITGTDSFDYNDYYSVTANGFYGEWLGTPVTSLAAWRTSSLNSMDINSISQDPVFMSETDLHLNTTVAPDFLRGMPLNVATDIDGDTRDTEQPYIGCDEPSDIVPVETVNNTVEEFAIAQNFPNPFNPNTIIRYQVPVLSKVTLVIYDVLGNEIITLVNEEKPAGRYEAEFSAAHLSSGIYFYRFNSGIFSATNKMVLLK